jgi:hypothetical protein
MFKKVFTLMYSALTWPYRNEERMYGHDYSFRIYSTTGHYFSFWIVGCRTCFMDSETKQMKSFGKVDEFQTVEVVYNDFPLVQSILGKDTEEMGMDYQTDIENFYKVLDAAPIDWAVVVKNWLSNEVLISESFERNCTIQASKEFKCKLLELVSY